MNLFNIVQYYLQSLLKKIFKTTINNVYPSGCMYYLIKTNGLYKILIAKNHEVLKVKNNQLVSIRYGSSDLLVYEQVFINKQYNPIVEYFHLNRLGVNIILDCGANIGLSSIFFSSHFPNAKIFAYEPDGDNFKAAEDNVKNNPNINIYKEAIWSESAKLKMSHSFRDTLEWSRQVLKVENEVDGTVAGISLSDIIQRTGTNSIDLLKIDIEGAEFEIFKNSSSLSCLEKVKIICIEIHNEIGDEGEIISVLNNYGFKVLKYGELTLGVK